MIYTSTIGDRDLYRNDIQCRLKGDGGFPYDGSSNIIIKDKISKDPLIHNLGISMFLKYITQLKYETGWPVGHIVNIPEIRNGFRGRFIGYERKE
ncbi:MAG TPA: hypothetical protein DCY35_04625 [Prolixibacteraceae bacterium]|jgi:hypothetical protein|nr:hypothetical protein [Prolixibacteraceae bacterium]